MKSVYLFMFTLCVAWSNETKVLQGAPKIYLSQELGLNPLSVYKYHIHHPPQDTSELELIVLHRGTEVGRLKLKDHYQELQSLIFVQKFESQSQHKYKPTPYQSMSLFHWPAVSFQEALQKNSQWKDGLFIQTGIEETGIHKRANSNFKVEYTWIQKWNLIHFGLMYGTHKTSGFNRLQVSSLYNQPIYDNNAWAYVIGLPGVRLRIDYYVPARPKHNYLEMDSLGTRQIQPSKVIREDYYLQSFDEPPHTQTISLEFKYSYLYYLAYYNNELYHHLVHETGLRDLPIPFGRWGSNFTWSGPSFILGLNYVFAPIEIQNIGFNRYKSDISWIPLELKIKMNSFSHLYIALLTQIHFTSPFSGENS